MESVRVQGRINRSVIKESVIGKICKVKISAPSIISSNGRDFTKFEGPEDHKAVLSKAFLFLRNNNDKIKAVTFIYTVADKNLYPSINAPVLDFIEITMDDRKEIAIALDDQVEMATMLGFTPPILMQCPVSLQIAVEAQEANEIDAICSRIKQYPSPVHATGEASKMLVVYSPIDEPEARMSWGLTSEDLIDVEVHVQ